MGKLAPTVENDFAKTCQTKRRVEYIINNAIECVVMLESCKVESCEVRCM